MTPADFKAAFPAFAAVADPTVQAALDASGSYFNADTWGGFLADGMGNWVAHRLTMRGSEAAAGPLATSNDVTDKSVGSVRVGRSSEIMKMKLLNQYYSTAYGAEYLRLARQVGIGPRVV